MLSPAVGVEQYFDGKGKFLNLRSKNMPKIQLKEHESKFFGTCSCIFYLL